MAKKPTLAQRISAAGDKSLNDFLKPPKAANNKRRSKPLIWDGDSECFSDMRYSASAGGVFVTFERDGYQDFIEMDRAEAKDWFDGDVGRIYNAEYR